MPKRKEVVRLLENHGFLSVGGAKHEKFKKGSTTVMVPRHTEIDEYTYHSILKQAGLK